MALIDRTAMRIGRERYLDARGTRGAGTLLHARRGGERRRADAAAFRPRAARWPSIRSSDARLAAAIARVKTIPGKRLLMYRDDEGKARAIRTEELNRYLRDIAGATVTAKDFRTLHASAMAAEALAKLEPGESPTARKRQLAGGHAKQVAAFLQQYAGDHAGELHRAVPVRAVREGQAQRYVGRRCDGRDGLRVREARLAAVLEAVG